MSEIKSRPFVVCLCAYIDILKIPQRIPPPFWHLPGFGEQAEPASRGSQLAAGINSGPNPRPDRRPRPAGPPRGGQQQKYLNGLGQRV